MLFNITYVKDSKTLGEIQPIEADSLYEAYKIYLAAHEGVDLMQIFNLGDEEAVKAVQKSMKQEGKTMKTTKTSKKNAKAKTEAPKAEIKKTPVKAKKAEPKEEPIKNTAVYSLNEEHNGVEIKFNEKPSTEVRAELKALKFRWHQTKGLWYAKQNEQTIALAKKLCGETEPKKQSKKPAKKAEAPKAEVKAEEPKAKKPSRKGIESYKPNEGERITDRLVKALNRTEGITAEIIAKNEGEAGWLWVTGEATKEHKDTLKKLGFFWSGKKQAWYMSPAPLKRNYRAQYNSMDALKGAALA